MGTGKRCTMLPGAPVPPCSSTTCCSHSPVPVLFFFLKSAANLSRALYNKMHRCNGNIERGAARTIASKPNKPDSSRALNPWGKGREAAPRRHLGSPPARQRCPSHTGVQPGRKTWQSHPLHVPALSYSSRRGQRSRAGGTRQGRGSHARTARTQSGAGAYPARLRKAATDYAVSPGLSFHTSFFLYKYRFTREVIIILSKLLVQSKMRRSIKFVI